MHIARQANDITIREKNVSNAPVIIAPIALVAAKGIAKRTSDVRIVPRMPLSKVGSTDDTQPRMPLLRITVDIIGVIAKNKTAMPNKTHKNAEVTVITAIKRSVAAIIPMIILAAIAIREQSLLLLQ